MRQGISPAKRAGTHAHVPAEIGILSLVFIPSLLGFYTHALEVLSLHLDSLRSTLPQGEILVWDNGSCEEAVNFLEERFHEGQIDYLFLSRYNLGKAAVLNWALASLPHPYIGFTDGDLYFFEGWWEAIRKVFRVFPKAGMVSPAPAFFDVLRGSGQTESMLQEDGFIIHPCTIHPRDAKLYYHGLGYDLPKQLPEVPCAQSRDGTEVCARSGHHVFVMPRDVARLIPPLPAEIVLASYNDRLIHERVEQAGYWQLSTSKSFVYHLGNTPDLPDFVKERPVSIPLQPVAQTVVDDNVTLSPKQWVKRGIKRWVHRHPRVKKKVERVYDGLFRLLYVKE